MLLNVKQMGDKSSRTFDNAWSEQFTSYMIVVSSNNITLSLIDFTGLISTKACPLALSLFTPRTHLTYCNVISCSHSGSGGAGIRASVWDRDCWIRDSSWSGKMGLHRTSILCPSPRATGQQESGISTAMPVRMALIR